MLLVPVTPALVGGTIPLELVDRGGFVLALCLFEGSDDVCQFGGFVGVTLGDGVISSVLICGGICGTCQLLKGDLQMGFDSAYVSVDDGSGVVNFVNHSDYSVCVVVNN